MQATAWFFQHNTHTVNLKVEKYSYSTLIVTLQRINYVMDIESDESERWEDFFGKYNNIAYAPSI